jgi:DNA-binding transcriptional regulator PaaX
MQLNRPFATVTPTLDGDVLAVLATHDVTFTAGQIHRILNGFSEEGIRKVLTRLAAQGVVVADRVGNAFTYRLNTEHLAAEPIRALARLTSTFLTRLEDHLEMWQEKPEYGAVFGSAATGTMTLRSDVDIFLVRDHGS